MRIGAGIIAGARGIRGRAAAENRLAEVAEKASLSLPLTLAGFMRRRLELGDPVGRRLEGLLLNERRLGENIGRVWGRANGFVDEKLGFRVARRRAVRVDALE